jgi:CubicO group peptidase (beta-lactamase class C family)
VGDKWRYNNSAYALAGLLIEKISGMPYEDYIVKHVLTPLGITVTHPVNPTDAMYEMLTVPYIPTDGRVTTLGNPHLTIKRF